MKKKNVKNGRQSEAEIERIIKVFNVNFVMSILMLSARAEEEEEEGI